MFPSTVDTPAAAPTASNYRNLSDNSLHHQLSQGISALNKQLVNSGIYLAFPASNICLEKARSKSNVDLALLDRVVALNDEHNRRRNSAIPREANEKRLIRGSSRRERRQRRYIIGDAATDPDSVANAA